MTHDEDDDIPTIGAYVPPPPGGGGSDGSDDSPWGSGKRREDGEDDDAAGDDDADLDDESLDAGRPDEPAAAAAGDDAAPADARSTEAAASAEPSAASDADDSAGDAAAAAAAADADATDTDTDTEPSAVEEIDLATPQASVQPGPSAFAPTRGLTDAGAPAGAPGRPAAADTPAEPGLTFVSTAGNPDAVPATYGEGDDEVPARIGGRFEVLELLGKGGMGRVYRVRDAHISGRELALKVLHKRYSESPYFKELFFREIKTAQGFVSEHVNQVRDTGITDDGQLFLTMDLVEGETLRALMRREHSLGVRHALEICRQVLLGLQSGHDQGFIHRDVKPENVMLAAKVAKTDDNPFGVGARLLDFGLAGLAAELEEGGTHGTPMYMSPEQAKGERLDPRSDLFAVGTLMFELLVGSRPFHGKTVANVLTSVIETDASPLIDQIEHVDKRVRKLLRKALAKKRDDRFQSAAEFIKAIEKAPAFQPPTEMPAWAGAAIAVLLVTSGAGAFMWWQANEQVKAKDSQLAEKESQITAGLGSRQTDTEAYASLLKEKEDLQADIAAKDTEIARLEAELGTDKTADELWRDQKDAEIKRLEDDYQSMLANQQATLSENQRLADEVADLKQWEQRYKAQNDPDTRAAEGFDRLLTQIERGFHGRAHKTMAQLVDAEVFAETNGLPGKEFVEPLGETCLAVANYGAAADPASQAVYYDAAQAAFERARAERDQFAVDAERWLAFRESADAPDPGRLDGVDRVLEALAARLGGMQIEAATSTENLWESIKNGPADQDPTAAFQVAFQAGGEPDDQLRSLALRYANFVERDLRSGLDGGALAQADRLPTWAALLDDPRHAAAREWTVSRDLLLLAFAQEWTAGGSPRVPSERDLTYSGSPQRTAQWDWRREAVLKAQLITTNAAWPLRPTAKAIYRRTSERQGTQWLVERGDTVDGRPEDGNATWIVDRSFFRERAGEVETPSFRDTPVEFRLHGGRSFAWQNEAINLNHEARVARFERGGVALPGNLDVSADEVARFEQALRGLDGACLVITTLDGKERWISPELGLVREVSGEGDARQVTELVYTNVVR